ncbi:hypothetical protein [Carnobacterium maltaromaticum]|nr:hypothetical protein [Carnobacterium maltaromaticum]
MTGPSAKLNSLGFGSAVGGVVSTTACKFDLALVFGVAFPSSSVA